jgi:hypothetical protein
VDFNSKQEEEQTPKTRIYYKENKPRTVPYCYKDHEDHSNNPDLDFFVQLLQTFAEHLVMEKKTNRILTLFVKNMVCEQFTI